MAEGRYGALRNLVKWLVREAAWRAIDQRNSLLNHTFVIESWNALQFLIFRQNLCCVYTLWWTGIKKDIIIKSFEAFVIAYYTIFYCQLQTRNLKNLILHHEDHRIHSVIIRKVDVHFWRNQRAINQVFQNAKQINNAFVNLIFLWMCPLLFLEFIDSLLDDLIFLIRDETIMHGGAISCGVQAHVYAAFLVINQLLNIFSIIFMTYKLLVILFDGV